jgi:hypothetical protein
MPYTESTLKGWVQYPQRKLRAMARALMAYRFLSRRKLTDLRPLQSISLSPQPLQAGLGKLLGLRPEIQNEAPHQNQRRRLVLRLASACGSNKSALMAAGFL